MTPTAPHLAIWAIALLATGGVLVRPFQWPEAVWTVAAAAALLGLGLLPWQDGLQAAAKGGDVYLFLTGMMLLSETARAEGLFDAVAGRAVNHARGSPQRLFALVYTIGIVVTTFLSNDAAAVVLTPAVYAATKKAGVEPLPYLFICALIANAASFVLPISNPANLVLYGDHMPPLGAWLKRFALPALLAIVATFGALWWVEGRHRLGGCCEREVEVQPLGRGAWTALAGIVATAVALLVVSALDMPLGWPTCLLGVLTSAAVLIRRRAAPWALLRGISWAVLPLVAGLFVLVEALNRTGASTALAVGLRDLTQLSPTGCAAIAGGVLAVVSNLVNNLPAGLLAATTIAEARPPQPVIDALLVGVDLGPNLSITGSLATILWLTAIRREGEDVGFWRFLRTGALVMPPALLLALAGLRWSA